MFIFYKRKIPQQEMMNFKISVFRPYKFQQCNTEDLQRKYQNTVCILHIFFIAKLVNKENTTEF